LHVYWVKENLKNKKLHVYCYMTNFNIINILVLLSFQLPHLSMEKKKTIHLDMDMVKTK
jgi:hypothetical protein